MKDTFSVEEGRRNWQIVPANVPDLFRRLDIEPGKDGWHAKHGDKECGCLTTALLIEALGNRQAGLIVADRLHHLTDSIQTAASLINKPYPYVVGLVEGWDNSGEHVGTSAFTDKDEKAMRESGQDDGWEARQAVAANRDLISIEKIRHSVSEMAY